MLKHIVKRGHCHEDGETVLCYFMADINDINTQINPHFPSRDLLFPLNVAIYLERNFVILQLTILVL